MIISKSPLRISFFGGGTDFHNYFNSFGGEVISAPLNKSVYVIINDDFDGNLRLSYSSTEIIQDNNLNKIKHPLLRETLKYYEQYLTNIEITSIADITRQGSGLGSSSAFIVALLNALDSKYNLSKSITETANLACNIEIEKVGSPIGIQDQWAASVGQFCKYTFSNKGTKVFNLDKKSSFIDLLNNWGMFFYSGGTRQANTILKKQENPNSGQIEILHEMKKCVNQALDIIHNEDIEEFGKLLDVSWKLKRNISSKVSNDKIDKLYSLAIKNGALGGKLLGAGGEGFLFMIVPPEKQNNVLNGFDNYCEYQDIKILNKSGGIKLF